MNARSISVATFVAAALLLQSCGGHFDPPPAAEPPPLPPNAALIDESVFGFLIPSGLSLPYRDILTVTEASVEAMQLLTEAAARLQRHRPFIGPITYDCEFQGELRLRAIDRDGNRSLTVSDSIIIEFDGCDYLSANLTLQVANAMLDGDEILFLEGEVDLRARTDFYWPQVSFGGTLQYQALPSERRWLATNWLGRSNPFYVAGASQMRIEKAISTVNGRYRVASSGLFESNAGAIVFDTDPAFTGIEGEWPVSGGRFLLRGAHGSQAAIRARGTPYVGWRVDADGDGAFNSPEHRDYWPAYLRGSLFGRNETVQFSDLPPE